MRLAIALHSIAHEGLIKSAIHSAATNNGVKLRGGDADFFGQSQGLRIHRGISERQKIVEQFHFVPGAIVSHVHDGTRPSFDHGCNAGINVFCCPNHGRQFAGFGLNGCAAQRCIGHMAAMFRQARGQSRCRIGI